MCSIEEKLEEKNELRSFYKRYVGDALTIMPDPHESNIFLDNWTAQLVKNVVFSRIATRRCSHATVTIKSATAKLNRRVFDVRRRLGHLTTATQTSKLPSVSNTQTIELITIMERPWVKESEQYFKSEKFDSGLLVFFNDKFMVQSIVRSWPVLRNLNSNVSQRIVIFFFFSQIFFSAHSWSNIRVTNNLILICIYNSNSWVLLKLMWAWNKFSVW